MIPNSHDDYKPALDTLYGGYAEALSFLRELLLGYGVRALKLEYSNEACFNMNIHSGVTEKVEEIRLCPYDDCVNYDEGGALPPHGRPKKDDDLVVIGEVGGVYSVGEDIDGQDNFILCNIGALLRSALDAAKKCLEEKGLKIFLVKGVEYETDGEEVDLPRDMQVVAEDEDTVVDRVSDITGWLVKTVRSIREIG